MVARSPEGEPGCCRFRESHWRVVVQPRPLDVETSVSTTRIERTLALLSESHAREAAQRWVGCVRQNSCSFERRVSPSNADVKREFIAPAKKRESPRLPFDSRSHWIFGATRSFARWKIDPPCSSLSLEVRKALLSAPRFCLAFRPEPFSFGCIFQCVFVMSTNTVLPDIHLSHDHVQLRRYNFLLLARKKSCRRDSMDYHEWAFVSHPRYAYTFRIFNR